MVIPLLEAGMLNTGFCIVEEESVVALAESMTVHCQELMVPLDPEFSVGESVTGPQLLSLLKEKPARGLA